MIPFPVKGISGSLRKSERELIGLRPYRDD
jgi:hypothetical protein